MPTVKIFEYDQHQIEFDLSDDRLMVNASEMGRIFGKKTNDFLNNESTKNFIQACLTGGNSRQLVFEKETDLVIVKERSGTWMHRILALKFAAWLSPEFEWWVYTTIDGILFEDYRELKKTFKDLARVQLEQVQVKAVLRENPQYKRLEELEHQERQIFQSRKKYSHSQIKAFKESEMDAMKVTLNGVSDSDSQPEA